MKVITKNWLLNNNFEHVSEQKYITKRGITNEIEIISLNTIYYKNIKIYSWFSKSDNIYWYRKREIKKAYEKFLLNEKSSRGIF